jgi:flagellar hook-associated protein 3 FlgL
MTRVSENQSIRGLVSFASENKRRVNEFSNQLTSGIKVSRPGDSIDAGVITRYQQQIARIESYSNTIAQAKSYLTFQDEVVSQANDLLIRAKEVAQQGANETLDATARGHLAEEVFQIRDQMAALANSSYQGKYVWGGSDDDDPPFDQVSYTEPAVGNANKRYVFDAEPGTSNSKSIKVTDEISVALSSQGQELFGSSLEALERLSRALAGYATTPASGTPDGGGAAYTFPTDYHTQTQDIKKCIDLLNAARDHDLIPERVSIGGRLRRIETGEALLELSKNSAQEVLNRIQNADETEAAANLQQAQTALQASYSVTAKVLRLTILDYV